jgi:hypothetical protein
MEALFITGAQLLFRAPMAVEGRPWPVRDSGVIRAPL